MVNLPFPLDIIFNFTINNPLLVVAVIIVVATGASAKKLIESEKKVQAAREQTIFFSLLYIFIKSGKTLYDSLKEVMNRRDLLKHLSEEANRIIRLSDLKTTYVALNSYEHPNTEFMLLIRSLGEDVEGGFGLDVKLEGILESAIVREGERWQRFINSVETLGEATVAVILLTPLFYILGTLFGGFNIFLVLVIVGLAALAFYIIASATIPTHLIEIPRHVLLVSLVLIAIAVVANLMLFVYPEFYILIPLVTGVMLLAWGLFAHFQYIRVSLREEEGAYLMLENVSSRMRSGYPVGKSLEAIRDVRYVDQAKRLIHGLATVTKNKLMRVAVETVKIARYSGLGAFALGLLARLILRIHLSFLEARARMRVYDMIAIASGAIIIALAAFVVQPFTQVPAEVQQEFQRFAPIPSVEPVYPAAVLTGLFLGITISKPSDQTIITTWRAGAALIATLVTYIIALSLVT